MADDPILDGIANLTRALAAPWRMFGTPPSRAMLEGLRGRNVMLDALFYDVKVVRPDEALALAPPAYGGKAEEGSVLIVTPSGGEPLRVCTDLDDFFTHGGADLDTLTVAGVGSSGLGTAAFARNVADALGRPVAAVVSGYGLADLADEAAGGFLWFYGLTSLHDLHERIDRSLDWVRAFQGGALVGAEVHPVGRDSDAVLALLTDARAKIATIVAHSKGNLVVSDALHTLQRTDRARSDELGAKIHVVSISSRHTMPRSCRQVTEIVGRWDRIGDFAMRREAPPDVVVPDAWHHTNTDLFGHLPVTKVLKKVFAETAEDG